ncbi:MAG TPA: hypothetical protein VMA09_10765 [Candidatus Binataceae bacterium]|nr:hypothetical protein [Candidatus Binataceae bacterium]
MNSKAITRRSFLASAAASIVLVAGKAHAYYGEGIFDGTKGPAWQPWTDWSPDAPTEPLNPVRAAILAANPHNTQPWLFRVSPTQIDLFADTSRNIGSFDPYLREMHVGLGCALENLMLAAPANGYACDLRLLPGPPDQVARVSLAPAPRRQSELCSAITKRHTNRGAYDTHCPIGNASCDALAALGNDDQEVRIVWFRNATERDAFGSATIDATAAIIADDQQSRDSYRWLRPNYDAVQRYRDGLSVLSQPVGGLTRAVSELIRTPRPIVDKFWLASTRDTQLATASAFGIIVVPDSRSDLYRLRAGRLWQRMHLWAVQNDLAMQPMNQIIERAEREQSAGLEPQFKNVLANLIGNSQCQAVMAFRVGYASQDARPSARRDVDSVVIS